MFYGPCAREPPCLQPQQRDYTTPLPTTSLHHCPLRLLLRRRRQRRRRRTSPTISTFSITRSTSNHDHKARFTSGFLRLIHVIHTSFNYACIHTISSTTHDIYDNTATFFAVGFFLSPPPDMPPGQTHGVPQAQPLHTAHGPALRPGPVPGSLVHYGSTSLGLLYQLLHPSRLHLSLLPPP